MASATWHGSEDEMSSLVTALKRNCTCEIKSPCASHEILWDQKTLDKLLFARRTVTDIQRKEHDELEAK